MLKLKELKIIKQYLLLYMWRTAISRIKPTNVLKILIDEHLNHIAYITNVEVKLKKNIL